MAALGEICEAAKEDAETNPHDDESDTPIISEPLSWDIDSSSQGESLPVHVKSVSLPAHDHAQSLLKGDMYIVGQSDNMQDNEFDKALTHRPGMPSVEQASSMPDTDKFKGLPKHRTSSCL